MRTKIIAGLLVPSSAFLQTVPTFTGKIFREQVSELCAVNDDATEEGLSASMSRRNLFSGVSQLLVATSVATFTGASNSNAFDNKISSQYDDRPKRRGPQPKDLNVGKRKDMVGEEYKGLKNCGPAPNCFCSTDDVEDDPDHSIPAWKWPQGLSKKQAFEEIEETLKVYKPGHDNIDGGGFKIVTVDTDNGYIYAQYEALKNGYIDDLEFAYIDGLDENAVQVRSSSRVGYLDFGVNSKRLNYIAKNLKEKGSPGWNAPGVDYKTHRGYFSENNISP